MNRPSEKALSIAEDLLDYVHPGMTRAAALHEVASMVDDTNSELLEAVNALVAEVEQSGQGSHTVLLNHLRHVLVDYQPWEAEPDSQHELFGAETSTCTTSTEAVAGQMP